MQLTSRWMLRFAALLIILGAPAAVFAAGSGCQPTSCNAPEPGCNQTTQGTNNCGGSCSLTGPDCCIVNTCNAAAPACDQTTYGTDNCGGSCSETGGACCNATTCSATEPTECDQCNSGMDDCGGTCYACSEGCPEQWEAYGYAAPGHPTYGFGLPDNNTRDFLGLAAKGNIVIGDYTSDKFEAESLPRFGDGESSITQPYAIDPSDASLGYHDDGFDAAGRPRFSGNYDQWDGGYKLDANGNPGEQRKFYESSLSDAQFQALVSPGWKPATASSIGELDAALFTNHLITGYAPQTNYLYQFGSMVGRDDGLVFYSNWWSDHDTRLNNAGMGLSSQIALPFGIKRPRLMSWSECPPAGCPDD